MENSANSWIARAAVILLFCTLATVGLADVWLITQGPQGGTVSDILYRLCSKYPIMPFLAGLLIGHLVWPVGNGK